MGHGYNAGYGEIAPAGALRQTGIAGEQFVGESIDVLTLDELALYLKLSRKIVERQAVVGTLPGRRIEGNWRFLRSAIDHWLSAQSTETSVTLFLQQAGIFAANEAMETMLADIYAAHGRR
ncbi:MAG: helix-turn-helix domain-containing protein [Chloroflexota bacterium]|nr:helix-turn-helix domain-containing protein [Chloroflexota bacterium]